MPATKPQVDNFDEVIKAEAPKGFSVVQKAVFGVVAAIASTIPAYLFMSRFFSVEKSYLPLFIVMTVICTVVLSLCYNKLATEDFGHVMERKKRFSEAISEEAGKSEAGAYGMFIGNLVFEASVFILTFVIMPRFNLSISPYVLYIVVTGLAGAFTFGFSYKYI